MTRSDVVSAALGASTGLAGLILVFLGVVIGRYDEILPGTSKRVRARFAGPTTCLFGTFVLGLVTSGLCFGWLAIGGGHCWYVSIIVLFLIQLGATAVGAGYVVLGVMLKK
jgi:hypothetical protein